MIIWNKWLLALLAVLVMFASVGMVASDDSGSGSVVAGDDSLDDDVSYGDDSNTGSLDSDDDEDEDPLDEAYYDSDSESGSGSDYVSVSLTKHATGNPLFVLLIVLIGVGGLWIRH